MHLAITLPIALLALLVERQAGYPQVLQGIIGHPVQWIGHFIGLLDERLNRAGHRRLKGVLALAIVLAAVAAVSLVLSLFLRRFEWGWTAEALISATFLAQASLKHHVAAVADGLDESLDAGRTAVSHLVGRDPQALDTSGVARAAIESLAENTSDGIVAPALWLALFGLPGIALYKAINTADSMIGHKDERYGDFGWASARLDDLVNLPAARFSGLLFAAAGASAGALQVMWRDASRHQSPNAGWPESATAGALDIRLGGPRSYEGEVVDLAWMGDGRADLDASDIRRALGLYGRALNLLVVLVGLATVATRFLT